MQITLCCSAVPEGSALQSIHIARHGGALVEWMTFNRRVEGSTPDIAAMYRDLGQVIHLPVRFGVKLRYIIRAVVGSASEW